MFSAGEALSSQPLPRSISAPRCSAMAEDMLRAALETLTQTSRGETRRMAAAEEAEALIPLAIDPWASGLLETPQLSRLLSATEQEESFELRLAQARVLIRLLVESVKRRDAVDGIRGRSGAVLRRQGKRGRGDRKGGPLEEGCPCSVVLEEAKPALSPAAVIFSLLAPELGVASEAGTRQGNGEADSMHVDSTAEPARGSADVKPEPSGEGRESASLPSLTSAAAADRAAEAPRAAAGEAATGTASSTTQERRHSSGQSLEPLLTLALGCFKSGWVCPQCARGLTGLVSPLLLRCTAIPQRWVRKRSLEVAVEIVRKGSWAEREAGAATPAGEAAKKGGEKEGEIGLRPTSQPWSKVYEQTLTRATELVNDPAPVVRTGALESFVRLHGVTVSCEGQSGGGPGYWEAVCWRSWEALMPLRSDPDERVRSAAVQGVAAVAKSSWRYCSQEQAPTEPGTGPGVQSKLVADSQLSAQEALLLGSQWASVASRHAIGMPTLAFLCLSEMCTDSHRGVRLQAFREMPHLARMVHPGHIAQGFHKRLRGAGEGGEHKGGGPKGGGGVGEGGEHDSPGVQQGGEGERGRERGSEERPGLKRVKTERGSGEAPGSSNRVEDVGTPPRGGAGAPAPAPRPGYAEGEVRAQEREFRVLREAAAGAFVHGLEDESRDVRMAALAAISGLAGSATLETSEEALPHVLDELGDEIPAVRLRAVASVAALLGAWGGATRLGEADRVRGVCAALGDSCPCVRGAARRLLGGVPLGSKQALLVFVEHLLGAVHRWPRELGSFLEVAVAVGGQSAGAVEAGFKELLALCQQQQQASAHDSVYLGGTSQTMSGHAAGAGAVGGSEGSASAERYAALLALLLAAARAAPFCVRPLLPDSVLLNYRKCLPQKILTQLCC